ncbi:MAG: tRNA (N6-threonylcarbamoyladenosine(37)-N6)-methyltransferase TrmO, partial [Firmicutes bacterium]|nr:tRNA (N6-threonylcarbamoyladenosine(37)-N6)-methyltransferase TrmO [Bacillota bacterium]
MLLKPIGIIHSPYKVSGDAPRQGRYSEHPMELEIYEQYVAGLKDIDRATHLIVLHWLHHAKRDLLLVKTPHRQKVRGVFACRSPVRPNPIAFNVVKLIGVRGNRLTVQGLDALD